VGPISKTKVLNARQAGTSSTTAAKAAGELARPERCHGCLLLHAGRVVTCVTPPAIRAVWRTGRLDSLVEEDQLFFTTAQREKA